MKRNLRIVVCVSGSLVISAAVLAAIMLYRQNAALSSQLATVSTDTERRTAEVQDRINLLSDRLDGFAANIGDDIASAGQGRAGM